MTIGKLSCDIEGSSEGKTHSAFITAQSSTLPDAEDAAEDMDLNTIGVAMSLYLATPQGLNLSPKEYCYKPHEAIPKKVYARATFVISSLHQQGKSAKEVTCFFMRKI